MNTVPDVIWIWVGAFLTLCIFSFLYKDNPFYRFAEHVFIGASNGWSIGFYWHRVLKPDMYDRFVSACGTAAHKGFSAALFNPYARSNFLIILPGVIGLLYFMRFVPRKGWLVRIPIGIAIGYYTGVSIQPIFEGVLFPQIKAVMLTRASFASFMPGVWAVVVLIGVISTLMYFFFSKEQKGIWKYGAKTGIIYIMVGFGASFGFTVMARVSLAIGRFVFLLRDWLHIIT